MGKIIEIVPGSLAWHQYRASRIGASDSATILGLSPFKTESMLYEEKIHGKQPADNPAMKRGRERETEALRWAEKKLGVLLASRIIEHDDYPWKFATLDGICPELKTIVEVKWPNKTVHDLAKRGKVIDYYYSQMQSQMACANVDIGYFLSCYQEKSQDPEFILVQCYKDQKFINDMIEKEQAWYINHIVQMNEPGPQDKDYVKIENENFDEKCKEYLSLSHEIANLERQKKELLSSISYLSDDRNVKSQLFKATKFKIQGMVDYKSIKELDGIDLGLYRKEDRVQWKISEIK